MVQVSVIVPLYNKAPYVAKCIGSITAQTYRDFEIIVIDDGSTDDSAAIVRCIRDERLTVISQPNQGVSAARNRGIQEAKHDLVAFLDADDWWDPEYLSKMIAMSNAYPDILLYSAPYAHVEQGVVTPSDACQQHGDQYVVFDALDDCVRRRTFVLPFSSSSVVIRKEAFSQAGLFDPNIGYCEDYDLFIRICIKNRCAVATGRPLAFYNKDIPVVQRATGRLFPLERSLVGTLAKFEPLLDSHPSLREYIDTFRIYNLLPYVEAGFPEQAIAPLLRSVDQRRLAWKHRLYFSFTPLGWLFVRLNVLQRTIRSRWRSVARRSHERQITSQRSKRRLGKPEQES
jgi:glycosyltransferase involved in cell wall biosynthesis